ncbi:Pff1p [Sugiyamaella lignohabitans]|uniref:Peptide hydrolase n=1 Tax=Sugiyamaella lignohabitans TaxID=796027 RepID=A0A167FBQ7_9ASCO|nr:Pff1p [Sugiyamaella lignohabitans]ANB15081.1 Pff1p [Sugiyamaella lignohabitans]
MTDSENHRVIGGTVQHHGDSNPATSESEGSTAPVNSSSETAVDDSSYRQPKTRARSNAMKVIASTFGFNRLPFSLVFLAVYVTFIIGITYIQSSNSPYVPTTYHRRYLDQTWTNLQVISRDFHPYGSHANDRVHDYILKEVETIVSESVFSDITIDAAPQKIMFAQGDVFDKNAPQGKLTYYESNNVLVKVPGSDPALKAVLLSAHYDSVPTGHGTTDDGVGVASMIGVLRYILDNRNITTQPRTLIFNFNNNEEFGLLGAEAFVRHPWYDEVESFLNLEGAGSGGRPVLFRTTDYGVAKHYTAASAPHGNSIPQETFDQGLVHSETDFSVYKRHGLRGLDIAFYRPRSLYHTNRDSIQYMSLESVSHMLTNAIDVTLSLAGAESYGDDTKLAVFFDILGLWFVAVPLDLVFGLNIAGLIIGPIIIALLWTAVIKRHAWTIQVGWYRGIFSTLISSAVTYGAVKLLLETNPFVFASQTVAPLLASFSLFLSCNYIVLGLADYFWPVHDQKLVIFIELFIVWWVYLVYATVNVAKGASGQYIATIIYYLSLSAIVTGLLGHLIVPDELDHGHDEETHHSIEGRHHQHRSESQNDNRQAERIEGHDEEGEEEANETTALIGHRKKSTKNQHADFVTLRPLSLSFDWILQFFAVVPIGLYISYSAALLVLDLVHQTLDDSNENLETIFFILLSFTFLMSALVLPFVHRLHSLVGIVLVSVTVICGFISFTSFPFTHDNPHKLRFRQSIDLDNDSSNETARVNVFNTGRFSKLVLEDLPSVKERNTPILCEDGNKGSFTCKYDGIRPWIVDNRSDFSEWLTIQTVDGRSENKGPNTGQIYINAPDVRRCTLEFNTSTFSSRGPNDGNHVSPVRALTVYHDVNSTSTSLSSDVAAAGWESSKEADVFKYPFGIDDVTLHKLDWNTKGFHIGLEWVPQWLEDGYDNNLGIQVTCFWGEYDQQVIIGGHSHRKVPALDEVLEYSPPWVSWVNWGSGLVEVTKYVGL